MRVLTLLACLLATLPIPGFAAEQSSPSPEEFATWSRPRLVGWASDSGRFAFDERKLRSLFPDFEFKADHLAYIAEHLDRGDSRAAIVASVEPLVVSAYSDELDAVILVGCPQSLVKQYSLEAGNRLVASWIYPSLRRPPADVHQGSANLGRHNNGEPLIADFLSSSDGRLQQRKDAISPTEWNRVKELTPPALARANGCYRSCFPLKAWLPPVSPTSAPAAR